MSDLGNKIRETRESNKMSLRHLARNVNISASFLSDIELGRRFPSEITLETIALELGYSPNSLYELMYKDRPTVKSLTTELAEAKGEIARLEGKIQGMLEGIEATK